MIVFRASVRGALLALLAALPAAAQGVSAPPALQPPTTIQPAPPGAAPEAAPRPDPTAPIRLAPRRLVRPAPPPESGPNGGETRGPPGSEINIQRLETVDAESVGTLDDAQGGLGSDMWTGSDRALVERIIGLMPRRMRSSTMRSLAHRLLLTRAVAPVQKTPSPGLFVLRVRILAAMGDLEGALSLIELAPQEAISEDLLWTAVESRFYRFDTSGACRIVQGEGQQFRSHYWQQATAFCLALSGKMAEATLISDVLQERAESVPEAFFAAMETLSGAAPPPFDHLKQPTGLHLAMLRAAKLPVPEDAMRDATPAVLGALVGLAQIPIEKRLAIAEKAAEYGVVGGRALFALYGDLHIADDEIENALQTANAEWNVKARALLIRAAARYDVPAARAEVLQQAIRMARQHGGFTAVALATHALLQGIAPAAELRWFAGDAARALLAAGDFAAASKWIALLFDGAANSEETAALWPLATLIKGGAEGVTDEALSDWWQRQDREGSGVAERAQTLFVLLGANGASVPAGLWGLVLDETSQTGARVPSVAVRRTLAQAAAGKRRGETVALALLALGEAGPKPGNLLALELAVAALRAVGLEDDARGLIIEAALAAGL